MTLLHGLSRTRTTNFDDAEPRPFRTPANLQPVIGSSNLRRSGSGRFLDWCERKGVEELVAIEPMHVAAFIRPFARPTENRGLTAACFRARRELPRQRACGPLRRHARVGLPRSAKPQLPTFAGKGGRPNPDRTGLSDCALALAAGLRNPRSTALWGITPTRSRR